VDVDEIRSDRLIELRQPETEEKSFPRQNSIWKLKDSQAERIDKVSPFFDGGLVFVFFVAQASRTRARIRDEVSPYFEIQRDAFDFPNDNRDKQDRQRASDIIIFA